MRRLPHRETGFSLVEVMAAMAIAALAAAVVVVALPSSVPETHQAAQRLAASLTRAQRAAVTHGAPVGLFVSPDGWRFAAWDGGAWRPLGRDSGFAPGAWPPGAVAAIQSETVSGEDAPAGVPALIFDETGGATPFVLRIGGRADSATLRSDAAGAIVVEASGA